MTFAPPFSSLLTLSSEKPIIYVELEPYEIPPERGIDLLGVGEQSLKGNADALTEQLAALFPKKCRDCEQRPPVKDFYVSAGGEAVLASMDDFEYVVENGGIVLTEYTGSASEVVIPAEHGGMR